MRSVISGPGPCISFGQFQMDPAFDFDQSASPLNVIPTPPLQMSPLSESTSLTSHHKCPIQSIKWSRCYPSGIVTTLPRSSSRSRVSVSIVHLISNRSQNPESHTFLLDSHWFCKSLTSHLFCLHFLFVSQFLDLSLYPSHLHRFHLTKH